MCVCCVNVFVCCDFFYNNTSLGLYVCASCLSSCVIVKMLSVYCVSKLFGLSCNYKNMRLLSICKFDIFTHTITILSRARMLIDKQIVDSLSNAIMDIARYFYLIGISLKYKMVLTKYEHIIIVCTVPN